MARSEYVLGVDLGTTFSAAAVHRGAHPEPVTLGANSYTVPSAIHVGDDGALLVGEAAADAARMDPAHVVVDFKRRVGDRVPIVVGRRAEPAVWFMGKLLEWIVARVSEREGARPARTTLTRPANWGPYKQELIGDIVSIAGLDHVATITEPAAAGIRYVNLGRVDVGETVAIYDFGGGTFDTAVLRVDDDGYELIGEPKGVERLGGVDIDWVVYSMVNDELGGRLAELDPLDPAIAVDLAGLSEACTRAKITLSTQPRAQVRARIGDEVVDVMIERDAFEQSIRPKIDQTVAALDQAIRSGGLLPADLGRILLVGGSSQIPLVARAVREAFEIDVMVDVDPTNAVATGAALHAHHELSGQTWAGATTSAHQPPDPVAAVAPPDAGSGPPDHAEVDHGSTAVEESTPGPRPPALEIRWDDERRRVSPDEVLTVGRRSDRDLVFTVDVVSRDHGEFRFDDGTWVYEDCGSANHSYVDGATVTRVEINGPLTVTLGRTGPALRVEPVRDADALG